MKEELSVLRRDNRRICMLTDKQLKERKLGIGGSDMPIIMGLSTYKTPYQLYLEKTGMVEDSQEMSEQQYWGHKLETTVREEFALRHNVTIETPDTLVHPIYDFMRANVDGFIPEENAVLEVKCSSSFMRHMWGEQDSDVIPYPYLVQVAHYCSVTNADYAYIAVLIGGNEYREYKYTRDAAVEKCVIEAAENFWNCVQNKNPPAPINLIDMKLMFPLHKETKKVTVNEEVSTQIKSLSKTRYQIKELNELEEQYKLDIMQFMQDAEALVDETGKPILTWRANKRGSRTFLMKGGIHE